MLSGDAKDQKGVLKSPMIILVNTFRNEGDFQIIETLLLRIAVIGDMKSSLEL